MFRDLPRYPEGYRPTQMPWCPAVPDHWNLVRNKNVMTAKSETVGARSNDYALLSLTKLGVIYRDITSGKGKIPASFDTYQTVDNGDIIMCLFDVDETPRTVGISRQHGMITGAYERFAVREGVLAEYVNWFYLSVDNVKGLRPLYRGLRKTVPLDKFMASQFPIPPADEQAAIVKYLAHANARIDKAVAAKRRLIALLGEQLQALDDRDLNDSTQASFRSARLKSLLHEVDQRSIDGNEQHLSMSQQFGLVPAGQVSRTLTSESMVSGRICQPGDIVLNRLKAHLGVFAVAPSAGVVSADYTVLRIRGAVLPEFLCMQLRSNSLRPELRRRTKGIVEGFWRLYTDDLLSMRVRLPDLPTQKQLVREIRTRDQEFRRVTFKVSAEVTLLQEFRTRLVADVVTGQVDVRAIAATLPDAPDPFDNLPSAFDDDLDEALSESEK